MYSLHQLTGQAKSLQLYQLFATLWTVARQASCPWDFPGKNTGEGCRTLFQGIFLTQGFEPTSLMSPALIALFFTTSATWEAPLIGKMGPVVASLLFVIYSPCHSRRKYIGILND